MDDSTTKICRKCGTPQPLGSFTLDKRYADGHYPWCAACRRAWRQSRKERIRELSQNWSDQNRDHVRKKGREYYHKHKDAIAPKRREYDRKQWRNNPDVRERKNRQKLRLYYENPIHRATHLANVRINVHRRRARIRGSNTHYTQLQWRILCAKYNHCCLCCGKKKPLTPDHVIPLSRGGSNAISNIQPLCLDCNLRKHAKTIDYRPLKQDSFLDGDGS